MRAALVNDWSRADGDRLMIAARRQDVRDLNERARQLLQRTGAIGPDELQVGDRAFATGDRVIGTRNDRHAGILNGQRGTILTVDREHESVHVQLDSSDRVELGATYLRPGNLDHGYAITAHRAQGASVDRSFVLGSEELYREWGYTALSRHREQARFYIARSDLHQDHDLPPSHDTELADISALLTRTRAKDLATASLPEPDRAALKQEATELRRQLRKDRAPWRDLVVERAKRDGLAARLQQTKQRETRWRELRAETPRYRLRERAELQQRADKEAQRAQQVAAQRGHTLTQHEQHDKLDQHWLDAHGPDAKRLLSIDHELRLRTTIDHHNLQQLNEPGHVDRSIDAPPPAPDPDRGPDLDLGW